MGSLNYNIGLKKELIAREYTFKDIAVPISKDEYNYDISQKLDIDAIKQSIRNIIDWTPGERIINPEFGNVLYKYMYEPINSETANRIASALVSAIESWEPRVRIEELNVYPDEEKNEYHVELIYAIPNLAITGLEYPAILSN